MEKEEKTAASLTTSGQQPFRVACSAYFGAIEQIFVDYKTDLEQLLLSKNPTTPTCSETKGKDDVSAAWNVCHFDKLPAWRQDNEYLRFGHRPNLSSFSDCFGSVFRVHTETGNIWTHLLGGIAVLFAAVAFFAEPDCARCLTLLPPMDRLVLLPFFVGTLVCLASSTLYHIVACYHSQPVASAFCRVDYAGIPALMVGAMIPWVYFAFYEHAALQTIYVTVLPLVGLMTVVASLMELFDKNRILRTLAFVFLGVVCVVPVIHCVLINGVETAVEEDALVYIALVAIIDVVGATAYASRFPECLFPGRFDIWCHSHQIHHCMVILATFTHYFGLLSMAKYRLTALEGWGHFAAEEVLKEVR